MSLGGKEEWNMVPIAKRNWFCCACRRRLYQHLLNCHPSMDSILLFQVTNRPCHVSTLKFISKISSQFDPQILPKNSFHGSSKTFFKALYTPNFHLNSWTSVKGALMTNGVN